MLPRTFSKQRRYIVCLRTFLFIYFILFAFSVSLSLLPNFFSFSSLSHQRPQLLVIEYLIKGKREKHFNPFDLAFCLCFLFFFYSPSIFLFYFCFSFSILMFCFSLSSSFLFPDLFFCPCHVLNVCADKSFVSQSIQKQGTGFSCF